MRGFRVDGLVRAAGLAAVVFGAVACKGYSASTSSSAAADDAVQATIGPKGGMIVGAQGSALQGVKVEIPAGALASDTLIQVRPAAAGTALPSTALRCGPEIEISPAGTALAVPARVTLPFDASAVTANDRFSDEVKVWVLDGAQWSQKQQVDSDDDTVTVDLPKLDLVAAGVNPPGPADRIQFDLHVNPKFLNCLAQFPDDPNRAPSARVTVVRGKLNDSLTLRASNIKPGLKFDMFTVENSNLASNGTVDPAVKNFGLAWYQSDVEANDEGRVRVDIRTILLDQIFGFDPAVNLPPTGTFHVGFWFNDPADAVACGFNPAAPTPFNGEHKAGPLAMISVPDAVTTLGPLCTHPDTSTTPAHCDP